jgi:hypothetical protein
MDLCLSLCFLSSVFVRTGAVYIGTVQSSMRTRTAEKDNQRKHAPASSMRRRILGLRGVLSHRCPASAAPPFSQQGDFIKRPTLSRSYLPDRIPAMQPISAPFVSLPERAAAPTAWAQTFGAEPTTAPRHSPTLTSGRESGRIYWCRGVTRSCQDETEPVGCTPIEPWFPIPAACLYPSGSQPPARPGSVQLVLSPWP